MLSGRKPLHRCNGKARQSVSELHKLRTESEPQTCGSDTRACAPNGTRGLVMGLGLAPKDLILHNSCHDDFRIARFGIGCFDMFQGFSGYFHVGSV